ncbi:hypothetical protein DMC30DRAFT_404884 [Rhodotorula diobovata]|uniref:Inactive metallocarboxypeptidase ECM14 n=1 Tax=Rhodotorula diobovata TaxID=5288 RepID=A0A5C5FLV2_9BASI|nr:hypothetical protein DMC30DRAFT_404884 [Rhodotorula diobovata]
MLSILLALATSARAVVADPSQSPPPPVPAQLAFGPPQRAHSSPGALVSFTWQDRAAFQRATQLFDDDDLDVWFAGRRSTVGARDPHWEAVVRFDDDLAQDDSVSRLVARVEPDAAQGLPPSALADHLSSPSGSTSYARALSAAVLANLSAAPLETLSTGAIHDTYHPYDGIRDILASLEEAHPEWVKVVSLGKSSQGRDIWAVKVTNQTAPAHEGSTVAGQDDDEESEDEDGDEDVSDGPLPFVVSSSSSKRHRHKRGRKLGFVIAGTQHAREWIAASTLIYLVHDLVAPNDKGKTTHHKLLNSVEFTFVPVVNPDGYVYSWDTDRLWRKSRQPVGSPSSPSSSSSSSSDKPPKACFGIDLNRNWGYEFQRGARPNPCSDSYPGREPFESVELQALRDYLVDARNGVDAFFDVHSFGQMLLFPYSFSCNVKTADEENHYEAVLQAAKALRGVHGRQFETGSVCEISLTSPGMSLDWTYASAKIRWSFGAELRDGGIFGFLLPPSQIRPSGEEMSAALRSLTQFILDKEAGKR